jgi:hypothetical protein
VSYVQRSIHSFFHPDLLGFYSVFDLIEFAVVSDGDIVPDYPFLSNTEDIVEYSRGWGGLMFIGFRHGLYLE